MKFKNLLFLLVIFLPAMLFGQNSAILIDSCGVDVNKRLNKHESAYFNSLNQGESFNFDNKNIAFAYGNNGKNVLSKKEYFGRWARDYFNRGSHVSDQFIILTEEESKASGYDAIVVSWSKMKVEGKNRKKIIKRFIP